MSGTIQQLATYGILRKYLDRQACVIAVRKADLPLIIKAETEQFIQRNVLQDCGRVPPNCLKAFMIETARKMGLTKIIPYVKKLFKADVGFKGYYLDRGELRHVDAIENIINFP